MSTQAAFSNFKVLTFDVVGTLIDFETGVLAAVRKISGKTPAELSDDVIFESYKRGRDKHYERSSEVMFHVYRYLAKELGLPGYAPYGPDSANLNLVLPQTPSDPISGSSPMRASVCEVARLE